MFSIGYGGEVFDTCRISVSPVSAELAKLTRLGISAINEAAVSRKNMEASFNIASWGT
jgi:hypothetical protein